MSDIEAKPVPTDGRVSRLLDWVRDEQDMPWGGAVAAAVADGLGLTVLEVRAAAESPGGTR